MTNFVTHVHNKFLASPNANHYQTTLTIIFLYCKGLIYSSLGENTSDFKTHKST